VYQDEGIHTRIRLERNNIVIFHRSPSISSMYEVMISDDEDSLPPVSMPLFANNTGNMLRGLADAQENVTTISLSKHGATSVASNVKSGQGVADGQW
jgi:hypothetical protein